LAAVFGALVACEPPAQVNPPSPPPVEERATAPALSSKQRHELSERCENASREQFRREWQGGTVKTGTGQMEAEFKSHYNSKLRSCFYLLTVTNYPVRNGDGRASPSSIRRMLFDIYETELYGEYAGLATAESLRASFPQKCRVISLYCASRREWEVLVEEFMEQ